MKVALIQMAFDKKDNLSKIKSLIKEASLDSELVLLQELHSNEYFCQTQDINFFKYADDFEINLDIFSKIAKQNKIVLLTSLFEKRAVGIYHNTAVVFDKDGSIAGKYRKMHIPDDPQFLEKFYFTPSECGFNPIKTSVGNLGVLICWDQWYPEAARIMALNDAHILIYPTAIGSLKSENETERFRQIDSWITIQRSHAIANGLPVVSINRVGIELNPNNKNEGIDFFGHSFICNPRGEIIAQTNNEECILYGDIDFKEIEQTRNAWPFLRDRRIDAYQDILLRYKK